MDEEKTTILQTDIVFETLLPNMPKKLPTETYEFMPPPPNKRYFIPALSTRLLARKIYLEMLKAIRSYGELENIAPIENKNTISNLKNQMEILSLAMLNIYGRLSDKNKVPFFLGGGTNLSKTYNKALQQTYDLVYHIHNLVFKLLSKDVNEQIKSTLIIVYTNLKSQLKTLISLKI